MHASMQPAVAVNEGRAAFCTDVMYLYCNSQGYAGRLLQLSVTPCKLWLRLPQTVPLRDASAASKVWMTCITQFTSHHRYVIRLLHYVETNARFNCVHIFGAFAQRRQK